MSGFVLRDRSNIHADLIEKVENPVVRKLMATVVDMEDAQSVSPGSSFSDFPDFNDFGDF